MIEMSNANDFKNKIQVEITKEEKEGYIYAKYKNVDIHPHRENRKAPK